MREFQFVSLLYVVASHCEHLFRCRLFGVLSRYYFTYFLYWVAICLDWDILFDTCLVRYCLSVCGLSSVFLILLFSEHRTFLIGKLNLAMLLMDYTFDNCILKWVNNQRPPTFGFFFGDRMLCSSGWSQNYYIAKDDLELPILLPLPLCQLILGLQAIPLHTECIRCRDSM